MIKNRQRKIPFRRQAALLLTGALLAGLLPVGTGTTGKAAEQTTLRNPRILKTTQEAAPGTSGKKELKNPTMENGITTWDCIWFGNYWQEDTNGDGKADKNDEKTPIKWRVLSVEGDDVFLLADKNLDCQRYNDTNTDVTWETCTMRSWLNGYGAEENKDGKDYGDNNFLNNAFSTDEQSAIKITNVVNDDNPEYGTEGGNDTMDQVYLLSIDEVTKREYGFSPSDDHTNTRVATNTAYTFSNNGWWLRSPGYYSGSATNVWYNGDMDRTGSIVIDGNVGGVCPALHLSLSSDSGWSYAGTVPSDDVAEWDCIWFGNYWQEDTNEDGKADKNDEKTPVKWRVLSVEGDDVFLLADKNLDWRKYNDNYSDLGTYETWETCTMRSWLNGYGAETNTEGKDSSGDNFLDHTFSAGEQSAIKTTNVVNDDNLVYEVEGGNDTADKVYLLSIDEVMNLEYGFMINGSMTKTREAMDTAYTTDVRGESTSRWWLRSPGAYSSFAACVSDYGNVYRGGNYVNADFGVRPALHLNLSSNSGWSYAGTVTSDGEVKDSGTPIPSHSPAPSEPEKTQKPQGATTPGTPSVIPSAPQPGTSATPAPGMSSDPGKATVEKAAPGKVSALKLKQKKRTVTASWKKLTGAKGYQICYSTSKKWKGKKQKLVTKNKAVIKNLKKKKTYYFRVRAYRLEGAKKVYGAWSGVKKIKIRK